MDGRSISPCDTLAEQYRTLLEVAELISTRHNLHELFQDLTQRLPRVVQVNFIALSLYDPACHVMRLHTLQANVPADIIGGYGEPIEETPAGLVWQTQQPIVVPNVAEEVRWPTVTQRMREDGISSFCIVPLTTALRRLGAMGFASIQKAAYGEADVALLQQIGRQVAVAVDNVLHHEELSRDRDRLRFLLEVSESIVSHRDLTGLFRDLARRLPAMVPFEFIALTLHDPERNVMRVHTLGTAEADSIPPGLELPVEGSFSGLVFRTQQPLVVPRREEETRFPNTTALLRGIGVESYCLLPLTTAVRRLGAMGFGSFSPYAFGESELKFLRQVAAQVAVAVDNVLHEESARSAQRQLARERDRQQLLLEVNNAVVSNLDLNDVFTAVSACLRKVIQHDSSSLLLYEPETRRYRIHILDFMKNTNVVEEGQADAQCKAPAGVAITTKKPVIFREADLKSLSLESKACEHLLHEGVKSLCCVPLLSHHRALGALNVGRRGEDAFAQDEIDLLSQVAQQVAIAVENALAYRQIAALKDKLAEEKLYLENEIRTEHNFEEMVGDSAALKRVLKQVEIVAPTDSTVLIQGETGTGKELVARSLHTLSRRRERTFVKLNCAAIPTGLLESELFGHEKGAFTGAIAQKIGRFELANGGTIFLDEVGEIPLELQSKLLRVLQEQEFERLGSTRTIRVDVRLIAATNRDLSQMVAEKQFRSDLYYRLNVFPIVVPPLRERREDIPVLVRYFAQNYARRMNKRIETIPAEAMHALTAYSWPGNVRELENFIERAVILSQGTQLQVPIAELKIPGGVEPRGVESNGVTTLKMAEREHIERALREAKWTIGGPSGAAARLGMKRTTLQSKMRKLGITRPQ
ncbi:sigma 54-interacting transcriptional regulator [Candidatus Nitrospira bockiana]